MTTNENATNDSKKEDFSFKGCEEMMKMMGRFMEGKGDKINFEQFCGKMSNFCREMMKKEEKS